MQGLAANTLVVTDKGHIEIKKLVGREVTVWDGKAWIKTDGFYENTNDLYTLELSSLETIQCTAGTSFYLLNNNKLLPLSELGIKYKLVNLDYPIHEGVYQEQGQYIKGFLYGDGSYGHNSGIQYPKLYVYSTKYCCIPKLIKSAEELAIDMEYKNAINKVEESVEKDGNYKVLSGLMARKEELLPWVLDYKQDGLPSYSANWTIDSKLEFLAGYFDADGSISKTSTPGNFNYTLTSIRKKGLLDTLCLLHTLGMQGRLSISKKADSRQNESSSILASRLHKESASDLYKLYIQKEYSIKLAQLADFQRLSKTITQTVKKTKLPDNYGVKSISKLSSDTLVYGNSQTPFTLTNRILTKT